MNYVRSQGVGVATRMPRRTVYEAPGDPGTTSLKTILAGVRRPGLAEHQFDLLRSASSEGGRDDVRIFYAGDLATLNPPCVSIVGTREVSDAGSQRASRIARELAEGGVTVVSGLAKGVDTYALTSAINAGGKVVAVIGTPLAKAYPAENASLQEKIWKQHLLMTPFGEGEAVFKSNFPKRNRVMAAISDATVIVEASDTSGTLHQAAECQRLGRWLFIMKSVAEDPSLKWPSSFIGKPKTKILEKSADVFDVLK